MEGDLALADPKHVGVRGWGLGPQECRFGTAGGEQGHSRMVSVVGGKRGLSGGRMFGIVVGEFCQGEEAGPVGLPIVHVHPSPNSSAPSSHPSGDGRQKSPQEILQPPPEVRSENGVPM